MQLQIPAAERAALKKEDIESAQVAARHSGFVADEVSPFLNRLRQKGYTRLNVMHLFRACAFVARPDGRNRTPLHELERREVLLAVPERVLESQCIPTDRSLWRIEQAEAFWGARRGLLAEAFNQFTHEAMPNRRL